MRNIKKLNWWLNSGGGSSEILGFNDFDFTVMESVEIPYGTDTGMRNPNIVKIGSQYICIFTPQNNADDPARKGITYATAPENDPHNWTKSGVYLVQSDNAKWFDEIDGGVLLLGPNGDKYLFYANYSNGKIGVAIEPAATTFGTGFVNQSDPTPLIDETAATGQWYQYLRHVAAIYDSDTDEFHLWPEARTGANDGPSVTDHNIAHYTVSSDLGTVTRDSTKTIDSSDVALPIFSTTFMFPWMPDVALIGNYYFMLVHCYPSSSGSSHGNPSGLMIFRLPKADIGTSNVWTCVTPNFVLMPASGVYGTWRSLGMQEPCWHPVDNSIYFDAAFNTSNFAIGRSLPSAGTFGGIPTVSLFEDDFDGVAVDETIWTLNETSDITTQISNNRLQIDADGTTTTALTQILLGISGFNSLVNNKWPHWTMTFDLRYLTALGSFKIGVTNAAGTNRAYFKQGSASNMIGFVVEVASSSLLSQDVAWTQGKLKISYLSAQMSFWEYRTTNIWQNLVTSGDGLGSKYRTVYNWGDETVYPFIEVANISGTPTSIEINDVVVKHYEHYTEAPFIISSLGSEEADKAIAKLITPTSTEQNATGTLIEAMQSAGLWKRTEYLLLPELGSVNGKRDLRRGKIATVSAGAPTYGANGTTYTPSDSLDTNFNPRNDLLLASRDSLLVSHYQYSINPVQAGMVAYIATDGTNLLQIFGSSSEVRFRINHVSPSYRRKTGGLILGDKLYTIYRIGSGSSEELMNVNGAAVTTDLGVNASNTPNATIKLGNSSLDGVMGAFLVGVSTNWDDAAWNTAYRQFRTDLGL